jgi:hypothetical protein
LISSSIIIGKKQNSFENQMHEPQMDTKKRRNETGNGYDNKNHKHRKNIVQTSSPSVSLTFSG